MGQAIEKEETAMRILSKSTDKKICGVCGGIAEYFGWDPTMVRVAWAVVSCFAGAGIVAYIIAAIIMPEG